ncbi:MAG: phytoene/squalene synthase family protein [Bacteroidales bacterium]|nr:phytoene/squalene synthase family protein [Bacteroidales bacterium]
MDQLYNAVAYKISRLVTREYSTSFSKAVGFLTKEDQTAIYSIYGFVRYADEIVDTFHTVDKNKILAAFEEEYYNAVKTGVSTNPILHSFQLTVKKYNIPDELVKAFLKSMQFDLYKTEYNSKKEMNEYIYGSADVVGLMCLKVFVNGDEMLYEQLKVPAMRLGSAFQKVNFLRDIKNDTEILKRQYFPELAGKVLTDITKEKIIAEISTDFKASYEGIKLLPGRSKLAVTIAYYYYKALLNKIRNHTAKAVMSSRIRITGTKKFLLFLKACTAYIFKLI